MPRLIVTEGAVRGLRRCRTFLETRNEPAARRAGQTIARHFAMLEPTPAIGRPLADDATLRELVIGFGDSGYVALYPHEAAEDAVHIPAFRHQRKAGS